MKSFTPYWYAGDWIPVRESSVKVPDKLGLSTVIVASNVLCYHTNCWRWFYFFWSLENPTVWQFNETRLLGSAFLNQSLLLCCVRCTINNESKWRLTSVKKKQNSSCNSVTWYHWISLKFDSICFLISNSVRKVNFHISNFQRTTILHSKFLIEQNSFGFSLNLHILLLVYERWSMQNMNCKELFVFWNVTLTTRTHIWLRIHFVLIRRVKTMISADI